MVINVELDILEKEAEIAIIKLELKKLGLEMNDMSNEQLIKMARALWGEESALAASLEES